MLCFVSKNNRDSKTPSAVHRTVNPVRPQNMSIVIWCVIHLRIQLSPFYDFWFITYIWFSISFVLPIWLLLHLLQFRATFQLRGLLVDREIISPARNFVKYSYVFSKSYRIDIMLFISVAFLVFRCSSPRIKIDSPT